MSTSEDDRFKALTGSVRCNNANVHRSVARYAEGLLHPGRAGHHAALIADERPAINIPQG